MFDFWIMQLAGQNVASCRNTSSRGTICRGVDGTARGSKTGGWISEDQKGRRRALGTQPARPPAGACGAEKENSGKTWQEKIRATHLQTERGLS